MWYVLIFMHRKHYHNQFKSVRYKYFLSKSGKLILKKTDMKHHWYFPKPMNDLFFSLHWSLPVYALHSRTGLIWPQLHNCCLFVLNSCSSSFLNLFCLIILFLSLSFKAPPWRTQAGDTGEVSYSHTRFRATATVQFWADQEGWGTLSVPQGVKGIRDKRIMPYCHTNTKTHTYLLHLKTMKLVYSTLFTRFMHFSQI